MGSEGRENINSFSMLHEYIVSSQIKGKTVFLALLNTDGWPFRIFSLIGMQIDIDVYMLC